MAILHLRALTGVVLLLAVAIPAGAWTDDPIQPGVTRVRAVHLTEIASAANARLASCGLPPGPVPAPGALIRAVDINAARASVLALYAGFGRPAPSFTDGATLAAGARLRAVYTTELRAAVDAAAAWPCAGCAVTSCSAAEPDCGATTSGTDNCGNACSKTGPACSCVPDGSCSAPAPACETTTNGVDNCGGACSKTGPACACVPDGSCTAAVPACDTTTNGTDSCGNACSKTGPSCWGTWKCVNACSGSCESFDGSACTPIGSAFACCTGGCTCE